MLFGVIEEGKKLFYCYLLWQKVKSGRLTFPNVVFVLFLKDNFLLQVYDSIQTGKLSWVAGYFIDGGKRDQETF